jgi:ABC-type Zn uptake system ZnuABC Zn-binding protein ZnuA
MSALSEKVEAIRQRLVKQAADPIDMGDYKQQMRAYQELLNDTLKALKEVADKVET